MILAFFCQITAKIDKNEENWQNPNRLMKFSEIWYVYVCQQKKCYKFFFFGFRPFWSFFNQKTFKIVKNEENWQNLNCLKFSEIWYADASQQKKCYKITIFRVRHFLAFFPRKQPKLVKNETN